MRICFVADSHPSLSQFGGIAVFTQSAARALTQLGHEVHVLVCSHGLTRKDFSYENVAVHLRPTRWLPFVGGLFPGLGESLCCAAWLFALNKKHSFDIVEFPNWQGIGLVSLFLRLVRGVVRLHTSTVDSLKVSGRKASRSTRFLISIERASCFFAEGIVTHSQAQRRSFVENGGSQDVTIIPHGISVPPATRREKSYAVLCLGGLGPRKGGETLLRSLPLVLKQQPVEFWIVGADHQHPLAKKFIAEHPSIAQHVQFLGFIGAAELARRYADCAIYASASIYESFGLTFVEAMSWEKPCVGCSAGAIPEIILHERSGLLVPPNNAEAFAGAIKRLLGDKELRNRMGQAGRELVMSKFSDTKMVAEIEKFFNMVVRNDRSVR